MTELLHQNIISLFGLSRASTGAKNQLLSRLVELVEKRVLVIILDRLTPEQQEDFLRILDNGTDEDRTIFLGQHVPDVGHLIDDEVNKIKLQARTFGAQYAPQAA